MKQHERFSDEFLNAFIDNELAEEDKDLLLEELRHNRGISNRICELRKVRDMVRHAYYGEEIHQHVTQDHKRIRKYQLSTKSAIAAGFLLVIGISLGWTFQGYYKTNDGLLKLAKAMQTNKSINPETDEWRLVLHVTTNDDYKLNILLNEAEKILQSHKQAGKKVKMNILANGKGLNLLRDDVTHFAGRIHELRSRYNNLTFQACNNAISRLKKEQGIEAKIVSDAEIVPSALSEIIHRQKEGWTYIKI